VVEDEALHYGARHGRTWMQIGLDAEEAQLAKSAAVLRARDEMRQAMRSGNQS